MNLEKEIGEIRIGIREGRFSNEASVSQGIVLRLLHSLGWPTYNTDLVCPEYSLSGRRVDFALCSRPSKPIAFIEVKQIGQSDGAERQLFEYAYHDGVPMAILTDGREWNFFLPGEQGAYDERRVYKLDIVDRDVKECVDRLGRYLLHSAVISGAAIEAARDDYRNVSKERQMLLALPKAWHQIIAEEDELLLEIVADRVESLCGFKPEPDMVAIFLKESAMGHLVNQNLQTRATAQSINKQPSFTKTSTKTFTPSVHKVQLDGFAPERTVFLNGQTGLLFEGHFYQARNAIDTLKQVFDIFISRDATFGERFAGLPKHGRTRRYLAKNSSELYYKRPDLGSIQLDSGWWMSTNHSKNTISQIISMACEVAQVTYGLELIVNLGD